MADLKQKLLDKSVTAFSWIETKAMTADVLTKEGGDVENMLEVVRENVFRKANSKNNMVVCKDGELMMLDTNCVKEGFDQVENFNQTRTGREY